MNQVGHSARPLTAERQKLVSQAIPLAEKQCRHFIRQTGAHYLAADLRSAALEALHDSAQRFEPERGTPFPLYVWRRVDGALSDALRQEAKHWRAAREDAYDTSEAIEDAADILTDSDEQITAQVDAMADAVVAAPVLGIMGRALRATGDEGAAQRATYARLIQAGEAALSALNEQERRVLVAHHIEGRTWQDVGAELGCSERTAKRRGADAAKRFAEAMRALRESM